MSNLYGRYFEHFLRLRLAVDGGDGGALLRLESEIRGLRDRERQAASMATFDVAMRLPLRGELRFARALEEFDRQDHGFFLQLLDSLRCGCAAPSATEPLPADDEPDALLSAPGPADREAARGGDASPAGSRFREA